MFGLTRREQQWKEERIAAELLLEFASVAVSAAANIRVAEANAQAARDALELAQLRKEKLLAG